MTIEERQKTIKSLMEEALNMAKSKGQDYSGNEDSLANFKSNADTLGMTKFQVWAVYFNKHVNAINNSIKTNPLSPTVYSEPIHGRIVDAIVYLTLLDCLLREKSNISTKDRNL